MDDNKKPIVETKVDPDNAKKLRMSPFFNDEILNPLDPQSITREFRRFKKRDPKFCRRYNLKYPIGKKATVEECKGLLVQIEKRLKEDKDNECTFKAFAIKLSQFDDDLDAKKVRMQKDLEDALAKTRENLLELEKTLKKEPVSENSLAVHKERLRQAFFLNKHFSDFFKEFNGK